MSGHSKWASIKHKKAAADSKRGKVFTRHIRELTYAAKLGGGDPNTNAGLRNAIDAAKAVNMPSDNIKKAIQRGTGELEGVTYDAVSYEGYGPGGAAIIVECLTDNKNRTVAEVRHVFGKYNGNMGETGCVGWMFSRKGMIIINSEAIEEDALMELVIENGAEDMKVEDDTFVVTTSTEDYENVLNAIKGKNIPTETAEITKIPSTYVKLEGKPAEQILKLTEKLEELDDVQNVYSNFDISDEEMEKFSGD